MQQSTQSSVRGGRANAAFSRLPSAPRPQLAPRGARLGTTARYPGAEGGLCLAQSSGKKEIKTKNLTLTGPVCHRVGTTRASQKVPLLQPLPAPSRSQQECLKNYKYNTLKHQVAGLLVFVQL